MGVGQSKGATAEAEQGRDCWWKASEGSSWRILGQSVVTVCLISDPYRMMRGESGGNHAQ